MNPNIKKLPSQPGIYLFLNSAGEIIYIGKAKNLKKRLTSYWQQFDQLTPAKQQMVSEIAKIQFTLVDNEWESLLLESGQIKKHQPKYNIVLRDDKSWGYLVLTDEAFPRLLVTHGRQKIKGRYFGPFSSSLTAKNLANLLNRILPLRRGSQNLSYQRLGLYQELNDPKAYQIIVKQAIKIIRGNTKSLERELKNKIKILSQQQNFELARIKRDQLLALEKLKYRQKIIGSPTVNLDLVNLAGWQEQVAVVLMRVRQGILGDKFTFQITNKLNLTPAEILTEILTQFYSRQIDLPKKIISPVQLSDSLPIKTAVPHLGKNKQLLDLLKKNAEEILKQRPANQQLEILIQLQKLLALPAIPSRVEIYDISNLQGRLAYGSMVVFVDGRIAADQYRLFKIKGLNAPNDVAMLKQVLSRRQQHADWPEPDLIILDGGKPQLNTVYPILSSTWKNKIIALAKREEEIFIPHKKQPLRLTKTNPLSLLLQNMRNQAHKFAIKNYRRAQRKEFQNSTAR